MVVASIEVYEPPPALRRRSNAMRRSTHVRRTIHLELLEYLLELAKES
jgi:hypothetical protein